MYVRQDEAQWAIRRLVAENENMRARLDRAINAAQEHFGEDAIRYKFSLMKNGRTRNTFPAEFDGKWFALQRADNDAHIGLCDRINRLESENEAHLAAMRQALEALELELMHGPLIAECHAAISTLKARLGDE